MAAISHVRLESDAKYTNRISAGVHVLTADESRAHGGTDGGPAPYDLVLAGLGACTSITLRMYAERKGWDLGTITVALTLSKDSASDVGRIEREVRFSSALTEEQLARLLEIAEKTPVTKTVRAGVPIATTVVK
jgi:putative redox protein